MVRATSFCRLFTYPRDLLGDTHPFERQRREELRAGNFIYRWFEPLIEEIAAFLPAARTRALDSLRHELDRESRKAPLEAGRIPGRQMAGSGFGRRRYSS